MMATLLRHLQEATEPTKQKNAGDTVIYLIGVGGVFLLSILYCCCKNACMNYRRAKARAAWTAEQQEHADRGAAGFASAPAAHVDYIDVVPFDDVAGFDDDEHVALATRRSQMFDDAPGAPERLSPLPPEFFGWPPSSGHRRGRQRLDSAAYGGGRENTGRGPTRPKHRPNSLRAILQSHGVAQRGADARGAAADGPPVAVHRFDSARDLRRIAPDPGPSVPQQRRRQSRAGVRRVLKKSKSMSSLRRASSARERPAGGPSAASRRHSMVSRVGTLMAPPPPL